MHGGGDEQRIFTHASDAISDAVDRCTGKFALGIVALTNLAALQEQFGGEKNDTISEAFRLRLRAILRPGDELVMLSGDMACLILDDLMDSNHLELAAIKLTRLFENPIEIADHQVELQTCSGLVYAGRRTRMTKSAADLYQMAENACSGTVLTGKPYTLINASEDQPTDHDWQLSQRIQAAMENHHITFDYQPKVDLESGDLVGGEALIRWRDNGTIVPPEEYLAALNDETLWQLTVYGYRRVLREMLDYDIRVPVSFNIDFASLAQPDFLEFMTRETNLWGVPTSQIVFEITENEELYDLDESKALLEAIREQGFKISLDDFGIGHADMQRIRELPLDEIKLDRSLCSKLLEDDDAGRICQSVITLANTLNTTCVADGVEDATTMQILKDFGCNLGQGFYLGAPMSVADFSKIHS